ncbi:RNA polymerase sigma factor [Amycolatopsis cihanbeyliensis]|uniref:RNA polymerase sigma factor n=1 Tax=Amycolatopsis cihanbeyliensis TaxID=1128664 RepID=A0A542DF73_AMYCI|nr:RNA polymerase sigma factor [Amycolatopsis cihanbeyliensis]TQJ01725.1 RNA polymerase sigma-70 factor (ECF subfamily) [Amycolatopsis cihanbeyliensis]
MTVGLLEVEVTVATLRTRYEVFAQYVLPETEVLYRVARTLTAQPADAEDLVQETLLRAYRAVDRFDGEHPRAWLLTILRNAEHNRHRRRRPQLLLDPEQAMERAAEHEDGAADPAHVIVDLRFTTEVSAAFDALPEKYREVVAMVDVDGLGYAEAAAALGVPIGTVMSRLHRGRKQIRRQLTAAGITVGRGSR